MSEVNERQCGEGHTQRVEPSELNDRGTDCSSDDKRKPMRVESAEEEAHKDEMHQGRRGEIMGLRSIGLTEKGGRPVMPAIAHPGPRAAVSRTLLEGKTIGVYRMEKGGFEPGERSTGTRGGKRRHEYPI